MKAIAESPPIRITTRSKAVLDEAIDRYRRDKFLDDVNAAYASLRSDPKAWKEEQAERALWAKTLADGLNRE